VCRSAFGLRLVPICAVAGLCALMFVLLCAVLAAPARDGGAGVRPRPEPLEWGLYQILWSRNYAEQLKLETAKFRSPPKYVMFYRDLGRPFPQVPVDAIHALGAAPVVSLELWTWHGGRSGPYLQRIIDGEYDAFFRQWAEAARRDGRRVMLRFGFEFNGDWFTWSLDPPKYVAAWRRAHDLFQKAGADNVEWVWSPNVVSCPDTEANGMHLYYPGDSFVDWVGVDGYNFGDGYDEWHRWESFDSIFGGVLRDLATRYPAKPLIITETASAPGTGSQRAEWIREVHRTLESHPRVRALIWFNYDKRREGEPNWRIDATPDSLSAFNETFAGAD